MKMTKIIEAKIIFQYGVPFLSIYSEKLKGYIDTEITTNDPILYHKALNAKGVETKVSLEFSPPDSIRVL